MKSTLLFASLICIVFSFGQINFHSLSVADEVCEADGMVQVTFSGGIAPYTTTLSGMQPTLQINDSTFQWLGLWGGNYSLDVEDALANVNDTAITVIPSFPGFYHIEVVEPTCGQNDGKIVINYNGGHGLGWWDLGGDLTINSGTNDTIYGVGQGYYNIQVYSLFGCWLYPQTGYGGSDIYVHGASTTVAYTSTTDDAGCGTGTMGLHYVSGTPIQGYYWGFEDWNYPFYGQPVMSTAPLVTGLSGSTVNNGAYRMTVVDTMGCIKEYNDTVGIDPTLNGCANITGNVYQDLNYDCVRNSGDTSRTVLVRAQPGEFYDYADANGDYLLRVPINQNYTISHFLPNPLWGSNCVASYSANPITSNQTIGGNDFADTTTSQDLKVSLWPAIHRPTGFNVNFTLRVKNQGLEYVNPFSVYCLLDGVSVDSSSHPYTTNGDTLFFTYSSMDMLDHDNIYIYTSSQAALFDTVCHEAALINVNDFDSTNNIVNVCREVRGSYDPNDKQVWPSDDNYQGGITLDDHRLTYQIRFQNTGTDTAFNIYITDTLDVNVDPLSIEVLESSHNYSMEIYPGNVLIFFFNNILLPDSNTNEPLSNGYVLYQINQAASNQVGDTIHNTANIYFDFNEPVITNTTVSPIIEPPVDDLSLSENQLDDLNIYPNPAQSFIHIDGVKPNDDYQILDLQGRILNLGNVGSGQIQIENLSRGTYILKVQSGQRFSTISFVKE